jgi:hypothetical protein
MAMNKKEREEFDAARRYMNMAIAMRWPEYDKPEPMTYEEIKVEIAAGNATDFPNEFGASGYRGAFVGWTYFIHTSGFKLRKTATTTVTHGPVEDDGRVVSWSRDGCRVYRTEADALRALRYDLTVKYASALAEVDARIKAAS